MHFSKWSIRQLASLEDLPRRETAEPGLQTTLTDLADNSYPIHANIYQYGREEAVDDE
jgi:hypothetical protein